MKKLNIETFKKQKYKFWLLYINNNQNNDNIWN